MLLVEQIKTKNELNEKELEFLIRQKLRINKNIKINHLEIKRKSIDARKELHYIYNVLIALDNENKYLKYKHVSKYNIVKNELIKIDSNIRPIIIGYGPSGLFATYRLFEAGLKPIVFDLGSRIQKREKDVELFFKQGIFNENSNVVYGEGGAGTFSDAKLTTRIKSNEIDYIIDIFIKHGANKEIKYEAHPHIGTDIIRRVIENITDYLIDNGVEFHFDEKVIDFIFDDNREIKAIVTDKNKYESNYICLGIGHSSYDTIKKLFERGVYIETKDTAYGFRVEHPKLLIDTNQYGKNYNSSLPSSEYFLRHKDIRGVYSFCMCPGGYVIPSNANKYSITTNGMSYQNRNNHLSNSAILIQISKDKFNNDIFKAMSYIDNIEYKAYEISKSYKALAMNIKDYINNELHPLIYDSSYSLGTTLYNFNNFFDEEDNEIFKKALLYFDTKIKGFIEYGIMVGPETHASSPIRIKRNEDCVSINSKGLYPMGEGAGYGGGIMSCGLDGIRIADKMIKKIKD